VAEARTTPELADTFYQAGPLRTRQELMRFFSRPDIRAQLRPEVPVETLAVHMLACIMGDTMVRMLFPTEQTPTVDELRARAKQGLDLFFRGVLR